MSSAKLFVRNLSWSVSEDDLYNLFSALGTVVSAKIPLRREDSKPRGFAFVEMGSPESAAQAISQYNGYALGGRDLVITYQDENQGGGGGRYNSGGASSTATKNAKLFVRNVSNVVSEQDLQALFSQVGTVLSAKIPTDRETGMQKPFAFVEMASADEAEQAIQQINNTDFHGKTLDLDYQDPNRARSGGGGRGGYGGGGRSQGGGGYGGGRGGYGGGDYSYNSRY